MKLKLNPPWHWWLWKPVAAHKWYRGAREAQELYDATGTAWFNPRWIDPSEPVNVNWIKDVGSFDTEYIDL